MLHQALGIIIIWIYIIHTIVQYCVLFFLPMMHMFCVYVDIIFLLATYLIKDSLANIFALLFWIEVLHKCGKCSRRIFVLKARFLWILSHLHITLITRTWMIDRRNGHQETSDRFDSFTSLYMPASCSHTSIILPNIVSEWKPVTKHLLLREHHGVECSYRYTLSFSVNILFINCI